MRLNKLKLRNFLSHQHTDFDLTRSLVILVGENGAGKSALARESITWALYGRTRGNKRTDDVIFKDADEAYVEVQFFVNADEYSVMRKRRRGSKTELSLVKAAVDITGATVVETQQKIEEVLGMSYEMFTCTVCIEQGKADSFSTLTPKEAKQMIMNILQLEVYDTYLKNVRGELGSLNFTIAEKAAVVSSQERSLKDHIDSISTQYSEEVYSDSLADRKAEAHKEWEISELTKKEVESSLQKVTYDVNALQHRIVDYKHKISTFEARLDSIKSSQTTKGKCPLCLVPITEESMASIVKTYKTEIGKYQNLLDETNVNLKNLRTLENQLRQDVMRAGSLTMSLLNKVNELTNQLVAEQKRAGILQEKETQLENLTKGIDELLSDIETHKRKAERYKILEQIFDKHGIPTLIIENTIPEIEHTANKVLSILSDSSMSLELATRRELKDGSVGNTLDIVVKVFTVARNYDMLSSGQRFRVDLAVRIALSTIMARRNNFKIESMIIDEGFGSLDARGRQQFVALSHLLKDTFKRLIIITHTDLTDYFPDLVTVEIENGISKISTGI